MGEEGLGAEGRRAPNKIGQRTQPVPLPSDPGRPHLWLGRPNRRHGRAHCEPQR